MQVFKIYSFETLEVWKESRKLVARIYTITNLLPYEEKYGLQSQMRRAALSISSNIAEGTSRKSLKDQARFIEISFGSLMELINQTILCFDLQFIAEALLIELRVQYDIIANKLNSLRESQIKRFKQLKSRINK